MRPARKVHVRTTDASQLSTSTKQCLPAFVSTKLFKVIAITIIAIAVALSVVLSIVLTLGVNRKPAPSTTTPILMTTTTVRGSVPYSSSSSSSPSTASSSMPTTATHSSASHSASSESARTSAPLSTFSTTLLFPATNSSPLTTVSTIISTPLTLDPSMTMSPLDLRTTFEAFSTERSSTETLTTSSTTEVKSTVEASSSTSDEQLLHSSPSSSPILSSSTTHDMTSLGHSSSIMTTASSIDLTDVTDRDPATHSTIMAPGETSTRTTSTTRTTTTTTTVITPRNLLVNADAELGSTSGWIQDGASQVIIDSGGQLNSGYNPYSGKFCFAGGYGRATPSRLVQNVRLIGGVQGFTEQQLDSGARRVEASFHYQTYDTFFMKNDLVEVTVNFRSASMSIIGTRTSGKLACRKSNPGWCSHVMRDRLPSGTRSVDYAMTFHREDLVGSAIDCYIDDNSLIIE